MNSQDVRAALAQLRQRLADPKDARGARIHAAQARIAARLNRPRQKRLSDLQTAFRANPRAFLGMGLIGHAMNTRGAR